MYFIVSNNIRNNSPIIKQEKSDPLPMSISDPVLDKPGVMDKFKEMAGKYEGEYVNTFN